MRLITIILFSIILNGCALLAPSSHRTPLRDAVTVMQPEMVCSLEEARSTGPAAIVLRGEPDNFRLCLSSDPDQIRSIIDVYGYSTAVAIMAHELHHYQTLVKRNDLLEYFSSYERDEMDEAQADVSAGCAIARMKNDPLMSVFSGNPHRYLDFLENQGEKSELRAAALMAGFKKCLKKKN